MKRKTELKQPTTKISIDTHEKTIVEIQRLITEKVSYIQEIIRNTILSINYYKKCEIFSNSDVVICINTLVELYEKTTQMLLKLVYIPNTNILENTQTYSPLTDAAPAIITTQKFDEINTIIDELQQIIDKISIVICGFGTKQMADLLYISFGSEFRDQISNNDIQKSKLDLILKHIMPTGYKTIHWKNSKVPPKEKFSDTKDVTPISITTDSVSNVLWANDDATICSNKNTDEIFQIELSNQYECYDADVSTKSLYIKLHGVRIVIHYEKAQKTLIVQGIVDDIVLDCIDNKYVECRKNYLCKNIPNSETYDVEIMKRIIETLTLKDLLIYGNADIYKRHIAIITEVNNIKYNKLNLSIKRFLEIDVYSQRQMLMNLLLYNKEPDIQYITYLLYDLITDSAGNATDSVEQMLIYDSFPWKVKLFFKETMKNTIKYTKEMIHKYDINRVTLEQQIYVMKVPENVKEKAMSKLKEVKSKNDDSGAKAKQYLEGLLKIPFGIYSEEPILKKVKNIQTGFTSTLVKMPNVLKDKNNVNITFPTKRDKYTTSEMAQYINDVEKYIRFELPKTIEKDIQIFTVKCINSIISYISAVYKNAPFSTRKFGSNLKKREEKINEIVVFLNDTQTRTLEHTTQIYDIITSHQMNVSPANTLVRTMTEFDKTKNSIHEIKGELNTISDILDESIHGHVHAKSQILKIIGQWITGEQSGYCFGFEGSPGIGKTSLAKKGLANCLRNGTKSRPFSFIALGGSCNGSTLEGHSYTYVNSTWGRITDILMETNCMNPIIYVDELDKVSKTEHGKEIIGILMHLIDSTQNTGFQDKYFSGIDLDLSKALFIFSYNDPTQIDKILLDRIHRIRFENLSLDEKKVIATKYIIPDLNRKMGFFDTVVLTDELIEYIIETYTCESGVRKLKEVLFDLFGEINIELLMQTNYNTNDNVAVELPYIITREMIQTKYLSKYDKIREKKIHQTPEIGVINGLWASTNGRGGIIPIQTAFFPASSFLDLRLTGLQGDVMKESMNVAKSVAWNLIETDKQGDWLQSVEKTKSQGLHIHCPEGAVSKDGPSAGAAITIAIYSLITKRPIRHNVAITGEINLQGFITGIGGLEDKISGGIKAGITTFLFPVENIPDYEKYMKKRAKTEVDDQIRFIPVLHINDTFEHVFI